MSQITQHELSPAEVGAVLRDHLNIEIQLSSVLSEDKPMALVRAPGADDCLMILASLRDGVRSVDMWRMTGGTKAGRDEYVSDFIDFFHTKQGGEKFSL